MKTETIAAIATAMTNAGIGIIRISGEEAFQVIDRVYRSKKGDKRLSQAESHTVHYGYICDGENVVDEVMVLALRAPNTYTREDTIEIDCHGGTLVMRRILETVLKNGVRAAEPGEFTKRAFLNGRMDLSQAEAVMDIIHAKNEFAMRSSVRQLKGSVSDKVRKLREDILYQVAYVESALDDPEYVSLDGYGEELRRILNPLIVEIRDLIVSADNGRMFSEGIRTVILGKPNVGKSSLMNVLLGEDRAIVTDIAGTTRDVLEEQIRLGDMYLRLIDTAGIRDTEDVVEKIGVSRAREAAENADLILYVADSACGLDENDEDIIKWIKGRKAVVLLNKSDLKSVVDRVELEKRTEHPVVVISAKEKTGMKELEHIMRELFFQGKFGEDDSVVITNVRHKAALEAALGGLEMVMEGIDNGIPEDFLTIDLMDAYGRLGTIIGESVGDDLIDEIFGRFCTGK